MFFCRKSLSRPFVQKNRKKDPLHVGRTKAIQAAQVAAEILTRKTSV